MSINKIAIVINTWLPKQEDIQKSIENTENFDEKIIYFNEETREFNDKNLPGFRVYGDGQNLSAADGFNFAIQQAKSDWICNFCIDDWFDSEAINTLLTEIKNGKYDDYDIIKCPCYCGNDIMKWKIVGDDSLDNLSEKIKEGNCITFSSIYKKRVWKEIGGLKNEPFNDWGWWMRVVKRGYKIFNYPIPTYYWQIHQGQLFQKEIDQHGYENIKQSLLNKVKEF